MIIGSKVFHKKNIYNSMDWAKENLELAPDGSVFIADNHEYTVGRLGSSWVFDRDQLVLTFLLKPEIFTNTSKIDLGLRLNQLNMAVTLGLLESLRDYNIHLKWPNDFYFNNKKVGGLLAKTVWDGNLLKAVIFGFALNVNNKVPILNNQIYEAISLSDIIGNKLDKKILLKKILESIDVFYNDWLRCEYESIFNKWKNAQAYIGKSINVYKYDGERLEGRFLDVTKYGNILLKTNVEILEISTCIIKNIL